MKNVLSTLAVCLLTSTSFATEISTLSSGDSLTPQATQSTVSVTCYNVMELLRDFRSQQTDTFTQLVDITRQSSQTVGSWYTQLHEYEGQKVMFPVGTFDPMKRVSDQYARNANTLSIIAGNYDAFLAEVLAVLPTCLK